MLRVDVHRRRGRKAVMTAAALVAGIAAVVTASALQLSPPRPAAAIGRSDPAPGCADRITHGRVTEQLQSQPPTVGFSLTYLGTGPCTIDARAPGLRLVAADGTTLAQQGASGDGRPKPVTLNPSDEVTFSVSRFLGCVGGPRGSYELRVDFGAPASAPGSRIRVSSLVSAKPFDCPEPIIGTATDVTVERH